MAFTITQDFVDSIGEGLWALKERLVDGGGTVTRSSDGTTFGAGDNLAPGGPYDDEWVADAWAVIQMPADSDGVVREIMLQLVSTGGRTIRAWFSSDGTGFSGGNATSRPTASDEQYVLDGAFGDDFFPAGTNNEYPVELTVWVGDAAEEYSWLCEVRTPGDAEILSALFVDVLISPYSAVQDPDKAVYFGVGQQNDIYAQNGILLSETDPLPSSGGTIGGWFQKGTTDAWLSWTMLSIATASNTSSSDSARFGNPEWPNMLDGSLWAARVHYARGARGGLTPDNYFGIKGRSRLYLQQVSTVFSTETMQVFSGGTRRLYNGLVTPWSPALPKGWG